MPDKATERTLHLYHCKWNITIDQQKIRNGLFILCTQATGMTLVKNELFLYNSFLYSPQCSIQIKYMKRQMSGPAYMKVTHLISVVTNYNKFAVKKPMAQLL